MLSCKCGSRDRLFADLLCATSRSLRGVRPAWHVEVETGPEGGLLFGVEPWVCRKFGAVIGFLTPDASKGRQIGDLKALQRLVYGRADRDVHRVHPVVTA